MGIPPDIRRIVSTIDANVSQNDRIALADYLATIESDDELYLRCVRKAITKLNSVTKQNNIWLMHWLPIILKVQDETS